MITHYTIKIDEINNIQIKSDVTFDLSELIERTNNGDNNLINDLFMATKVAICEYHSNNGAQKFYKRFCISAQINGVSADKKTKLKAFSFDNNSLIQYLITYHNSISEQTQKNKVHINDIKKLYEQIQSDDQSSN